jgi:Mlc titration factor MtfA (ptsG expression regulator)
LKHFFLKFKDSVSLIGLEKNEEVLKYQLEKYFKNKLRYYDKLPDKLKYKFLFRVLKFIKYKTFIGRDGVIVTDEMKALIAGAAVQLTFGLEYFVLRHFSKIIIYPGPYYSTITGKKHKGETHPRGIIVISWSDFLKGYEIPDDKLNLGLHEMAHALELEKRIRPESDNYFSNYFEKWKKITEDDFKSISEDRNSFLRSYAGTNRQEFFAVCVEYFFEAPEEFNNKLPEVFNHLCILLNQNPLSADMQVSGYRHITHVSNITETDDDVPLFSTKISYSRLLLTSMTFIIILIIFILNETPFNIYHLLFISGIITVYFIQYFINSKKIELHEKYISVKSFFGKVTALYSYDEIVSVSFDTLETRDSIEILSLRNGKMYRKSYTLNLNSGYIEELKKILSSKKIALIA